MPFIVLFVYLSYMMKTGHQVSIFDWLVLFLVGVAQTMAWFIYIGIISPKGKINENSWLDR